MKTVRTIIKNRLKEMNWSAYKLAKAVEGKMAKQTVYSFVRGTSELNTESLMHVMDALDLEIRPKGKR